MLFTLIHDQVARACGLVEFVAAAQAVDLSVNTILTFADDASENRQCTLDLRSSDKLN